MKRISGNNSRKLIIMKLESEKFKSIFTPELYQLLDIFQRYQHEIRVAGGAVRYNYNYNYNYKLSFSSKYDFLNICSNILF